MHSGWILVGSLALLMACSDGGSKEAADVVEREPVAIYAAPVRYEQVIDPIFATGEVTADKRTDIKPRVNGIIETIHVRVGNRVTKSQPLFETRKAEFANRVQELEHSVTLSRAEIDQALRDLKRAQSLLAKGVVSQGRMDTALTQHATAEARLGIAESSLAQARQDLADTVVRAPYDGMITARYVDEGTMVQVAASNTPVVELVKVDVVEIVAQVPATHLIRIREGTRAQVDIDGLPAPIDAILNVINDRVDAKTRSVEIRLRLPNKDQAIKPGLFAKVTLFPQPRRALVIERRAVMGIAGDNYVFVPDGTDNEIAKRRAISARDVDAQRVEILNGINAGETALAGPNLPDIRDGAPISLREGTSVSVIYEKNEPTDTTPEAADVPR
ncbi:MAG: efflux RND transporter periplasmic adaptor subunit [Proteobacteria bacterium]|nr:efflux RND transporter periplasmic adaptor subunit [Pseudomonadota bacterium]